MSLKWMQISTLFLGLLVAAALTSPVPQDDDYYDYLGDDSEDETTTSTTQVPEETTKTTAEKEEADTSDDEKNAKTNKGDDKADKQEGFDPLKAIGDAFAGLMELLGGVVNSVERVTSDPDVQEAVGGAIDTGIKTVGAGVDIANQGLGRVADGVNTVARVSQDPEVQEAIAGVIDVSVNAAMDGINAIGEIAERAPKVIEENVPVVEGLAKTIQETSGFVGGSIEELENGAQLASVFAEAYTNDTLTRVDNFLKVFNRRLRCNTKCPRLEGSEREECEAEFCEGFVPPKTKKQLEEEELKFIEEYEYDYDYENEQTEN